MTRATEFFAVQNALGFSNESVISSKPFAELDAKYADRIEDKEQKIEGFGVLRGIFVDGKMIVCLLDGQEVDADPAEIREALGM